MKSVLFVTGSGTEVGKTYVTSLLIQQTRASGRSVRAIKPVATGMVAVSDPRFAETDTARLLKAQGLPCDETAIAGCTRWRFRAPLSPDMAAAEEAQKLSLDSVVSWTRSAIDLAAPETLVLVEGVGGVMSPIASDGLNIDFVAALGCPAVLVGGSYLGAITHVLTAIEALRVRAIPLKALVLNETKDSSVDLAATAASLRRFASGTQIVVVRYGGNISDAPALS